MPHIALIGPENRRQELIQRLPQLAAAPQSESLHEILPLDPIDLLFDLDLDEHPDRLTLYAEQGAELVIGCAVHQSLTEMLSQHAPRFGQRLLGLNALPTFLDRPLWEVSCMNASQQAVWREVASELGIEIKIVQDQVGMVALRTILLIINEAYAVMEEGTANAQDIDLAMKLGTNYPKGPVQWADEIGLAQVVAILDQLLQETGSGRFAANELLRRTMRQQKIITK